jgi:pimeloyl-ACP methyl ester carboxylesterase
MATFVLVHGAWHGAWCWHKIVARLQARGHSVVAPDMPGHGIDRTPIEQVTLDSIAAKIAGVVRAQAEPVVLVGHSYGGTVITHTAELCADRVRTLVYLTAFLIPDGQTTLAAAADDPQSILGPNIQFSADGQTATFNPSALREAFYADCSDDDIALARLALVPEGLAGFAAPVHTTGENWGRIPRVYIECKRDKAIGIDRQRALAKALPCRAVLSLDTDHSPFFSAPDTLTDMLVSV